jgi:hypothetical protein
MKRALTTMVLLLACSHAALGDTVAWSSSDYTGFAAVFDRYAPGGSDRFFGPAWVDVSYSTTGPIDLTITAGITGIPETTYSVFDPNGQIYWSPGNLEFYAAPIDPETPGIQDRTMDLMFSNPSIPYTGGIPLSLAGLTAAGSHGYGQTLPPMTEAEIAIFGVPEPSSVVLLGTATALALLATRWARRKAAASHRVSDGESPS